MTLQSERLTAAATDDLKSNNVSGEPFTATGNAQLGGGDESWPHFSSAALTSTAADGWLERRIFSFGKWNFHFLITIFVSKCVNLLCFFPPVSPFFPVRIGPFGLNPGTFFPWSVCVARACGWVGPKALWPSRNLREQRKGAGLGRGQKTGTERLSLRPLPTVTRRRSIGAFVHETERRRRTTKWIVKSKYSVREAM